jgi:hypothetical protein
MKAQRGAYLWYGLLLVPFIALLAPIYLRAEPAVAGIPFFYAYQMLVIPLSAALTWAAYLGLRGAERDGKDAS